MLMMPSLEPAELHFFVAKEAWELLLVMLGRPVKAAMKVPWHWPLE